MTRRKIKSPASERVPLSPEAEKASFRYQAAILDRRLEPLADYLAAGHPMDHVLRKTLVELIDGRGAQFAYCLDQSESQTAGELYQLRLCQKERGGGGATALSQRRTRRRNGEIVAHFRLLDPTLKWSARVSDTASHFGLKPTAVKEVLAKASATPESRQSPKS